MNGVNKYDWQVSICVRCADACPRSAVKHNTLYGYVNVIMHVVHWMNSWMHFGFIVNKIWNWLFVGRFMC